MRTPIIDIDTLQGELSDLGLPYQELKQFKYHSNEDVDRQIFVVPDQVIVKAFSFNSLNAFKTESKVLEVLNKEDAPVPELLHAGIAEDAALIIISAEQGEVLNYDYKSLDVDSYCYMLRKAGRRACKDT